MKYSQSHLYTTMLALCAVALGLFLALTNPAQTSVGLLVIPVILLFLIVYCGLSLALVRLKIMANKPRKQRTVALVSASFLTIIMILQSTGGISGADVILLGLIIIMASIYISKY